MPGWQEVAKLKKGIPDKPKRHAIGARVFIPRWGKKYVYILEKVRNYFEGV